MAKLRIDFEKCVGCGLCLKACNYSALSLSGGKAIVDEDDCTLCGICTESCRFEAMSIEKEQFVTADLDQYTDVWVFAEQREGKILPVAFELLGKGRELADADGSTLVALLFGENVKSRAVELIAAGANEVLVCEDSSLRENLDEPYTELIAKLIEKRTPKILLFGATAFGRSLAPSVAARVQTGLTADCTGLDIDEDTGLLIQIRPAFGGNLMASIMTERHRPQMATVRPGVMRARKAARTWTGRITHIPPPQTLSGKVRLLSSAISQADGSIADAEIIVSAGRGIGSQKNLVLVRELAELLGASVGVSRPLVDTGWSEYRHQIGQTGLAVSPKLLICFGVSGAIQHLAGIGGAETIVAVNSDPDAPIFSVAHYKVVGDCVEILKALLAELKGR